MAGDTPPPHQPPPGWYPDPENPSQSRWWNGDQWTEQGGKPGRHQAGSGRHRQANNPPPGSNTLTPAPPTIVPGEGNGLAVAALVSGILGVAPFLDSTALRLMRTGAAQIMVGDPVGPSASFYFGPLMWVLAFIFGILGTKKVRDGRSSIGRWMALSGIVLGVVSPGLFLLAITSGELRPWN